MTAPELRDVFDDPDAWLAVAAFRTLRGATDFLGTVQALRGPDFAGDLVVLRATRVAGASSIGLGQEPHPAGSGPLVDELPDQGLYQAG